MRERKHTNIPNTLARQALKHLSTKCTLTNRKQHVILKSDESWTTLRLSLKHLIKTVNLTK